MRDGPNYYQVFIMHTDTDTQHTHRYIHTYTRCRRQTRSRLALEEFTLAQWSNVQNESAERQQRQQPQQQRRIVNDEGQHTVTDRDTDTVVVEIQTWAQIQIQMPWLIKRARFCLLGTAATAKVRDYTANVGQLATRGIYNNPSTGNKLTQL